MPNSFPRQFGRGLLLTAAGLLAIDGLLQLASPRPLVEALAHIGFPSDAGPKLAGVTLSCAGLLATPRLAPLSTVLTTGFVGGAICSHIRIGELGSPPQLFCAALGFAVWVGLFMANAKLFALIQGGFRDQ
jgi:hypothetical protein